MGDHRRAPPPIPWWYWAIRFDFEAHYREVYRRRGHRGSTLMRFALMAATLGVGP